MNLLHMRYALEVAKVGSLSKAAEVLLIAAPNISRSIKELEADLGITIFERTAKGMYLTAEGEEFILIAENILGQIEQVEKHYKDNSPNKQKFSVCVPCACYISEAFAEFSKALSDDPAEISYQEANSQQTINNLLNGECTLGIIRYSSKYDKHFKALLEEKGLTYEVVAEFNSRLTLSADSPLAEKDDISYEDLESYIELAQADPNISVIPALKSVKQTETGSRRKIFISERAAQFDLLSKNADTFMWTSPAPEGILQRYNLIQKKFIQNKEIYKDVLIYKNGYKLSKLDNQFITELCEVRRKCT